MLGVVRNLTAINFVIMIGIVAYAFALRISFQQIALLVLTALLSAVPVALPATFTLAAALGARTLRDEGRPAHPAILLERGGHGGCALLRQDRHADPE